MNTQDEEWKPDLPITQREHEGPLIKVLTDQYNNYLTLEGDYVEEKEESKEISEEARRIISRTTERTE